MRRYSEAVKADVRRRMSPPHRQSVARISEELGIHVVGEIPAGLPDLGLPGISLEQMGSLVPGAAAIALVAFAEQYGY